MPTFAKAIASFVSTFLGGLAVVLSGPASNFGDVTDGQWVALASSAVAAALVVYGVRNGISGDPTTSTPEVPPRDRGAFDLGTALVVCVCLVLLVILLTRI